MRHDMCKIEWYGNKAGWQNEPVNKKLINKQRLADYAGHRTIL